MANDFVVSIVDGVVVFIRQVNRSDLKAFASTKK